MRILACGGRDFCDVQKVERVFANFAGPVELCHGDARGADRIAGTVAASKGWHVTEFPAEWERLGKAAGPVRNQKMLDEFKPDVVVAFPGGSGTADMVRRAKSAGVIVLEVSR